MTDYAPRLDKGWNSEGIRELPVRRNDKGTSEGASKTYIDTSLYITLNDFANSTAYVLEKLSPKGVAGPDSGTRGSGRGGGDRFGGKKSLTSYLWCHVTKSSSLLAISRVKADDPRANPLCVTTVDSGLTE